jgi:hypothetical protein
MFLLARGVKASIFSKNLSVGIAIFNLHSEGAAKRFKKGNGHILFRRVYQFKPDHSLFLLFGAQLFREGEHGLRTLLLA